MLLPTETSHLKISFRNMILRDLSGKQESSLSVFESVIKVMNFLPSQIYVNIHLAIHLQTIFSKILYSEILDLTTIHCFLQQKFFKKNEQNKYVYIILGISVQVPNKKQLFGQERYVLSSDLRLQNIIVRKHGSRNVRKQECKRYIISSTGNSGAEVQLLGCLLPTFRVGRPFSVKLLKTPEGTSPR